MVYCTGVVPNERRRMHVMTDAIRKKKKDLVAIFENETQKLAFQPGMVSHDQGSRSLMILAKMHTLRVDVFYARLYWPTGGSTATLSDTFGGKLSTYTQE